MHGSTGGGWKRGNATTVTRQSATAATTLASNRSAAAALADATIHPRPGRQVHPGLRRAPYLVLLSRSFLPTWPMTNVLLFWSTYQYMRMIFDGAPVPWARCGPSMILAPR